jgi:hypothetical protein
MEISLVPGWLGKIDWSNGLPLEPNKIIHERLRKMDYWCGFKLTFYDEVRDYIKFMSINNGSSYQYYKSHQSYMHNIPNISGHDNANIEWNSVNKKQYKHIKYKGKRKNANSRIDELVIDEFEETGENITNIKIEDDDEDIIDINDNITPTEKKNENSRRLV